VNHHLVPGTKGRTGARGADVDAIAFAFGNDVPLMDQIEYRPDGDGELVRARPETELV
jgi:hypothetical protein